MNSLNSNYLDAFYQLAQTKHFTKAAQLLHISQSALSQRLQNLEGELQTTLVVRQKSGLTLTSEGEALLRYCQNKFQLEQEFMSSLSSESNNYQSVSGFIRIGGFSSIMPSLVLPKISPLIQSNPSVRIKMLSREIYELKDLLRSGEIDYAITYEKISDDSCHSYKITDEKNILVKHKDYKGQKIYIDHDENDTVTKKILKKKGFKPNERHFLDDVYGLIDGVKNKLGFAVIPYHLIKSDKSLVAVKPEKSLMIPVYINYYKQSYYTKLHDLVVEKLTEI